MTKSDIENLPTDGLCACGITTADNCGCGGGEDIGLTTLPMAPKHTLTKQSAAEATTGTEEAGSKASKLDLDSGAVMAKLQESKKDVDCACTEGGFVEASTDENSEAPC